VREADRIDGHADPLGVCVRFELANCAQALGP
jgi:hypothetical protein